VLLRFAQQRLVMARDIATAIELFLQADALLASVNDPAIVDLRASLAREVTALRALPSIDVAGLFAQLSARAAQVTDFSTASDATVQDFAVTAPEQAAADGWWNRVTQSIGEYFVVSRSSGPVVPQLSARDQFELQALVQLHIEEAKLALLRADPQLYRATLDEALALSRRWLRSADGSLDEFLAGLETLRDAPVVVDIPDTDQTLNALRRLSGSQEAAAQSAPQAAAPAVDVEVPQ
jgi:uroporphyrin-3 C-methyltransferase